MSGQLLRPSCAMHRYPPMNGRRRAPKRTTESLAFSQPHPFSPTSINVESPSLRRRALPIPLCPLCFEKRRGGFERSRRNEQPAHRLDVSSAVIFSLCGSVVAHLRATGKRSSLRFFKKRTIVVVSLFSPSTTPPSRHVASPFLFFIRFLFVLEALQH